LESLIKGDEYAGNRSDKWAWSSSDETVVTVDPNGLVAPVSVGEAVITVLSKDGYGSAEVPAKVTDGSPEGEPWKLTVMHTNDTHAHLSEVARRAALVKQVGLGGCPCIQSY
jgi:2',3'-cyclic-nucleotide 2'-phosphodiesterase / 3'-nucleotidase / 5'-nucleotidase